MMFLNSWHWRVSEYSRLQIAVRGTAMTVMSSRNFEAGIGLVLSQSRYPPGSIMAISLSQVCGFIATMRSTPPRAPRWPASVTRTSYQVGRPWMLDGKMLRGATGMPMRSTDRANNSFALAEPDPLTLANRTTKSFTLLIGLLLGIGHPHESCR